MKPNFVENPNLTARQASSLLKAELKRLGLPFIAVKSRTIGFADLARCSRIFAGIQGWKQDGHALLQLKVFAAANGFYVEVLSHADGSAVWS